MAQSSRGGLSLYANLLNPPSASSSSGTISRAPVVFNQTEGGDVQADDPSAKRQQPNAASLRFQPTKRPQLSAQKLKTKPPPPKAAPPDTDNNRKAPLSAQEESNFTARPAAKSTLADWAAEAENDDVNGFYGPEKRQRGGRKKRKKNKDEPQILQNWDDIYDPSRPNSYEEYLHSDEKLIEIREWKDRLYAHRMTRGYDSNSESDGVDYNRPQSKIYSSGPNPSFAPPSNYEEPLTVPTPSQPPEAQPKDSPKPVDYPQSGQSATVQFQNQSSKPSQPEVSQHPFSPKQAQLFEAEIADTPSQNFLQKPQSGDSSVPHKPSPNISRAPVRYNLPPPPPEIPDSEAELEKALLEDNAAAEESTQETDSRSLRPGQKDFAQRLMSKYGWTKGAGLGASGTGIINPLQVKIEKQKKDPDSQGGKAIGQANRGKIIGGKKKAGTENDSKFGSMSEVVVLHGMVDGMDLDAEMDSGGDGDLIQEIGDECAEKYGRVERVIIHRGSTENTPVLVKFTSQLSALRAVNALEGRIFNGNTISAKFYDLDRFEAGKYD